jgi:CRISPR system Cascade subunit CasE
LARLNGEMPLWRLALVADTTALLRQTMAVASGWAEPAYAVHAAFRRLFGAEHEPLTFHVHPSRDYRTEIETWSRHPLAELERLAEAKSTGTIAGQPQPFLFAQSREAPHVTPGAGARLAFALRCAPLVTSRARDEAGHRGTTREADAFAAQRKELLARAEAEAMPDLDRQALLHAARAACYRQWLAQRLPGSRLQAMTLEGFAIVAVLRGPAGARERWRLPVAELSGILLVEDPAALQRQVIGGIGRHKAYGLGMLRLGPPL